MNASGKVCPVCKGENEFAVSVCKYCGAQLEEISTQFVALPESSDERSSTLATQIESFINVDLIPEEGVGLHIAGEITPLYVPFAKELVIGRAMEATSTSETLLDLSDQNAGTLGVSRRHAKIQRTTSGYEVIDLSSRNGSWLNAERLIPNRPYPFASGSQLRIGNMRILIAYRPIPKS